MFSLQLSVLLAACSLCGHAISWNPHFALLWSDQMSDILGNVSDHWGMVTYNFFWNNFLGH